MVSYPGDWEVTTVDKVADINTGCRNTQDNKPNGRYKFFVRSPVVERIDVADYDCEAVLTAGDGNAGKVFHYINGKFSAHQRVYIINNFRNILGRFFYYYFSQYFIDEVRKYTAKSTVDSVRRPMIADMLIPLPPLHEQTAIADTLAAFDTHITNLTELISKKKAIRDGALEDLMSGRTRLKGFCGEWEVKTLGEVCKIFDGTHQTPKYTSRGVKFVSVENIHALYNSEKYISNDDYYHNFKIYPQKGDILMTRIGDIGTPCIVSQDEPIAYYVSLALLKYISINNAYLYYCIQGHAFQKELYDRTLHHATPKKINKGEIGKCLVIIPPPDEQIAIADTLTALDTEISSLEAERDKISQIRDGAMNDLLTGKVRLKNGN